MIKHARTVTSLMCMQRSGEFYGAPVFVRCSQPRLRLRVYAKWLCATILADGVWLVIQGIRVLNQIEWLKTIFVTHILRDSYSASVAR